MKPAATVLFLVATAFLALCAFSTPSGAELLRFSTGARYNSFESDRSREKGSQLYTPFTLSTGTGGLFVGLASGYVVSSYQPAQEGEDRVTVRTVLDTNLTLFYTVPLTWGCLRIGGSLNLPTGKETLDAREQAAEMDRNYGDLVEVTNFGQGFNADPGFAFTLPLGRLLVGFGLSRHIRGAYDPTKDVEDDRLDPGDETATKLTLGWRGDRWGVLAGVRYVAIGADKIGGQEVFKEGDMVGVNGKLEIRPRPVGVTLEAAYNTWAKGKALAADGGLAAEEVKRFGDDLRLRVTLKYRVKKPLTLRVYGRGHWVEANDYDRSSTAFDGGRTALEGGVGLRFVLLPGVWIDGVASYLDVKDKADALLAEDTRYKGFKTALNVVARY